MKKFIFLTLFFCILCSIQVFAQYEVGDYYVNGNTKGLVFYVNHDEGTLYLLKTDMAGRYEDFGIGDYIEWRDLDFVIQNANENYPYTVWDLPNSRMARLINQNHQILSERSKSLGYRILPRDAFLDGRVTSDGVQRLIPVFAPRYSGDDIFSTRSAADLLRGDEVGKCGILLYGIVDYRTGQMKKLY